MNLSVLFDDDQHTAADGPYARVMKTRKWLYFSAAAATAISLHLFQPQEAQKLLKVLVLPRDLLGHAAAISLVYLLIQYTLVVFQLWKTRDIVMRERLAYRRADELAAARSALTVARENLANFLETNFAQLAEPELNRAKRQLSRLETRLVALRTKLMAAVGHRDIDDPSDMAYFMLSEGNDEQQAIWEEFRRAHQEVQVMRDSTIPPLQQRAEHQQALHDGTDPEVVAMRKSIREASDLLEQLGEDDPAQRTGYRQAEVLIDIVRICPPAAFAVGALINLVIDFL